MDADRIIDMLLEHDKDIKWLKENVSTKNDMAKIIGMLDKIICTAADNSQEITMIHGSIERHDEEISQIKRELSLA